MIRCSARTSQSSFAQTRASSTSKAQALRPSRCRTSLTIASLARERNIWVLADNTWASPLYCQPLALGADVVIEAGTKYLVGHADALLGFITSNDRAKRHVELAAGNLGVCPGSEETYLGLRGLRTLDVRLARHQETGIRLAQWLQARPEVSRVLHPALSDDPGHALWKRDFKGATGLFSAILNPVSKPALAAFLDGLKLFGMGYSWGGYESLVIPFDCGTYRTATRWSATRTGATLPRRPGKL